jgi:hypothetical protein
MLSVFIFKYLPSYNSTSIYLRDLRFFALSSANVKFSQKFQCRKFLKEYREVPGFIVLTLILVELRFLKQVNN